MIRLALIHIQVKKVQCFLQLLDKKVAMVTTKITHLNVPLGL